MRSGRLRGVGDLRLLDRGMHRVQCFVGFDAGDGWLARLAGGDAQARVNLEPLDALGISAWRDGDLQRGLLRLTTD